MPFFASSLQSGERRNEPGIERTGGSAIPATDCSSLQVKSELQDLTSMNFAWTQGLSKLYSFIPPGPVQICAYGTHR